MLWMSLIAIAGCTTASNSSASQRVPYDIPGPRVTVHAIDRPVLNVAGEIAEQIGQPIVIDAESLTDTGFAPEGRVSLALDDRAATDALDAFGEAIGGELVPMSRVHTDTAIIVTTIERSHVLAPPETREHDIRPLLRNCDARTREQRVDTIISIVREIVGACTCNIVLHEERVFTFEDGRLVLTILPGEHREVAAMIEMIDLVTRGKQPAAIAYNDETEAARRTRGLLDQPVDVDWDNVRVEDTFKQLTAKTGVRFSPQWAELAKQGIDPRSVYSLTLSHVPLIKLVEIEMDSAPIDWDWYIDRDGVVVLTSPEGMPRRASVLSAYRINELAQSLARTDDSTPTHETVADARERIALMIRDRVDPAHWRDAGGLEGQMWLFGDAMIVKTSRDNHRAITNALRSLRYQYAR
jgi:hypothetical protein